MVDKLVEIERYNWPELRDLYTPNSPKTLLGHCCVDNFIRWTNQQPDFPNLAIYSLNGDWSDGTFAVIDKDFLFTYTLAPTNERLQKLLHLIDFTKGLKIQDVQSKDYPAILNVIKSKNLQFQCDSGNLLHHLPAKDALHFDITPPDGLTLRSIEQSEVHFAYEVWFNRAKNSMELLQELAKFNPNVGAFNNDGRMIAWVFRLPVGLLGALQVHEEFYGHGLGRLVCKALSRKIAEMGQDIGACVSDTNIHSLTIFKKLGFNIVDRMYSFETISTQ